MLQRHDAQQFGILLQQGAVTLLGPRCSARQQPVFQIEKLLLEEPPPEVRRLDRPAEKSSRSAREMA